jgi:hypothetical protein
VGRADAADVWPREQKVNAPSGGGLVHELPPASVTRLTIAIA